MPIDPINPYPQIVQQQDKTIQELNDQLGTLRELRRYDQNRINELEQELTLLQESFARYIDRVNTNINKLQEQVDNLLDPIERVIQNEEINDPLTRLNERINDAR